MNEVRDAMQLLLRLAGRLGFADSVREGLPVDAQLELFGRMADAKADAGLSTREFLSLDRRQLAAFCSKYGVTRAEVRFAQNTVKYMWQMWRTGKFVTQVALERNRRSIQ
jgi:hypothetical protein